MIRNFFNKVVKKKNKAKESKTVHEEKKPKKPWVRPPYKDEFPILTPPPGVTDTRNWNDMNFIYFDDTEAMYLHFHKFYAKYKVICSHANDDILVGFSDDGRITSFRVETPIEYFLHSNGQGQNDTPLVLNHIYDKEHDVLRIHFGEYIVPSTIQKTEMEFIELEVDNVGKVISIVLHDANNRITAPGNIGETSD